MRFALLTAAAALLAGASAQTAAPMVAGIEKLTGMADDALGLVRAINRPNLGEVGPPLLGSLTNIAAEMETQAAGLRPSNGTSNGTSSAAAATPFSDEEQTGVCDSFAHMAQSGADLLSGLMDIRPLIEGTQFMQPFGVMISRFGPPLETLMGGFMQLAPNCAQDTLNGAPDVGGLLGQTISMYTAN